MNHSKAGRKFGRVRKVRRGLIKSLALSLIKEGKIKTTDAKAREIRPFVEKLVTFGKKDTLAGRRELVSKVGPIGAKKITTDIAPKYKDRNGGYLRITKLQARNSDGSLMAVVEFV